MNFLLTLLSPITSLIGNWMTNKQQLQQAVQQTALAAEQNKARLLLDTQSNNHAWEMAQITDSDRLMRRVCFFTFIFPFIYAAFDPHAVSNYFTIALSNIPDWYKQIFAGIVGGVWGISSLKNALPAILNGFTRNNNNDDDSDDDSDNQQQVGK